MAIEFQEEEEAARLGTGGQARRGCPWGTVGRRGGKERGAFGSGEGPQAIFVEALKLFKRRIKSKQC